MPSLIETIENLPLNPADGLFRDTSHLLKAIWSCCEELQCLCPAIQCDAEDGNRVFYGSNSVVDRIVVKHGNMNCWANIESLGKPTDVQVSTGHTSTERIVIFIHAACRGVPDAMASLFQRKIQETKGHETLFRTKILCSRLIECRSFERDGRGKFATRLDYQFKIWNPKQCGDLLLCKEPEPVVNPVWNPTTLTKVS